MRCRAANISVSALEWRCALRQVMTSNMPRPSIGGDIILLDGPAGHPLNLGWTPGAEIVQPADEGNRHGVGACAGAKLCHGLGHMLTRRILTDADDLSHFPVALAACHPTEALALPFGERDQGGKTDVVDLL